jgi:hypothetical protein
VVIPHVSAVIVTRGNVDLSPILDGLPFEDVMVWDNSKESDLLVYGRYEALRRVRNDVVYVQDDDCVLPPESISALVDAHGEVPGNHIVANMPRPFREHYSDSCLVGFGAVFERTMPRLAFNAFRKFTTGLAVIEGGEPPSDDVFDRCCDVVFTTMYRQHWLDVPYANLPWATAEDRMYRQPNHVGERARVLDLARRCRDAVGS